MRRIASLATSLFVLAACTLEQQNGELRAVPGPLISDQPWRMVQQAPDTCTVSMWEINITQQKQARGIVEQVATSLKLNPGDRYKILIGDHVYETMDNYFNPADSRAIIQQFMNAPLAYTELTQNDVEGRGNNRLERRSNVIHTDGFAALYNHCTQLLRP